jgi:hypothetical protein
MRKVEIKCTQMAVVEDSDRVTETLVIFDPTPATITEISEWHKSGEYLKVRCTDRAGVHLSIRASRAVSIVKDYGTMLVLTQMA